MKVWIRRVKRRNESAVFVEFAHDKRAAGSAGHARAAMDGANGFDAMAKLKRFALDHANLVSTR